LYNFLLVPPAGQPPQQSYGGPPGGVPYGAAPTTYGQPGGYPQQPPATGKA